MHSKLRSLMVGALGMVGIVLVIRMLWPYKMYILVGIFLWYCARQFLKEEG